MVLGGPEALPPTAAELATIKENHALVTALGGPAALPATAGELATIKENHALVTRLGGPAALPATDAELRERQEAVELVRSMKEAGLTIEDLEQMSAERLASRDVAVLRRGYSLRYPFPVDFTNPGSAHSSQVLPLSHSSWSSAQSPLGRPLLFPLQLFSGRRAGFGLPLSRVSNCRGLSGFSYRSPLGPNPRVEELPENDPAR